MDNTMKCSACGMEFSSEQELKKHAQEAHNVCAACGAKFNSKEELQKHIQDAHKM